MGKSGWRKELDLLIDESMNELIRETKEYDNAIKKSSDKGRAQIWIALALLNRKINELGIKNKKYKSKIPKEELDKILKTLESM